MYDDARGGEAGLHDRDQVSIGLLRGGEDEGGLPENAGEIRKNSNNNSNSNRVIIDRYRLERILIS